MLFMLFLSVRIPIVIWVAPIFVRDLDHVLDFTRDLWEEVRGERIFLTGGTGFFGCWLLESFLHANNRLSLGAKAVVLTRSRAAFARKAPHLEGAAALEFREGDIQTFTFPAGGFSHVIHGATDSDAKLQQEQPLLILDSVVQGTRRTLELARKSGARKFLLTSSGAVYGRQPPELTHVPETYTGGPDLSDWRVGYSEGKRMAELLSILYHRTYGFETKIARCFAFVGPHLPLDRAFGIGNFLRDGLAGGPIELKGDGTPYRSYLYAADLAIWLWKILFRGAPATPYNVGSGDAVTMKEVAEAVAEAFDPRPGVIIRGTRVPGKPAERYVPDITLANTQLRLNATVSLSDAIRRTVEWLKRGE
jgi:nucleoside-diphosphate-sugar epimerase